MSLESRPIFEDVECEYALLVTLAAAKDINGLDQALESIFNVAFSANHVEVLSPASALQVDSESDQQITISSELHDLLRHVIIHEPRTSPTRRFIDAALDIYTNHYDLLLKSQVDKLTGLFNRQVLEEKVKTLNCAISQSERRENEVKRTIVLLDIDHFKRINDTFGHLYGDEVLVIVSHMMKSAFRVDDWLFRYGGEEFLVFLNNAAPADAQETVDRFLKSVEAHDFPQIGRVTMSAGYVQYDDSMDFVASLDKADKALYFSKENGRNQHHGYDDLVAEGQVDPIVRESDIDLF